ncbi:hypothetical protein K7W42_15680 [Deinococcus sp. HMF7604]|uniref:hypothetical protein n=1 Tax=Deinococcus betulae TaxID=2873312 RepID=UPI001CC90E39|nr:hypothetical protein [Deinococcus betulae]MBZ9752293.1 hypothetical protein [Deinococcus betulae]
MSTRTEAFQYVLRATNLRLQPGRPGRDRPLRRQVQHAYTQTHHLLGDPCCRLEQGQTLTAQAFGQAARALPLMRGGVQARLITRDNLSVGQEALDLARTRPLRGTLPDLQADLQALGAVDVDLRGMAHLPLAGAWAATPTGWDWRLLELSVACPKEGCRLFVGHARLP